MTKIFNVPFALEGDKISPPDAVQSDGSVSYTLGYGFDYQRDTGVDEGGAPIDPLAKVFPREQHNGILNDITTALGEIQINGLALWQASGAPYPINALVRHSGYNWRSLFANNTTTPGAPGASWVEASYQPQATETVIGISKVATQPAVAAGLDDSTFITPLKLSQQVSQATEIKAGIAKISSYVMALSGSDDSTIMTPAKVKYSLDNKLPFVPVEQGGGAGMFPNKLRVGWSGSRLLGQVDTNQLGPFVFDVNLAAALTAFLPKRTFRQNDFVRIPDVPGGIIIQFGMLSSAPDDSYTRVSFPTPFTNKVLACFAVPIYGAAISGNNSLSAHVGAPDLSGMSIGVSAQVTPAITPGAYWFAIGN